MRDLTAEPLAAASEAPRFGTFLGVFTPSLLTILGVIMYQRLGWVIGNAGLGGALLVILLAHAISVTTGLSVASIATNHTVKTGGNYYIISRSLGLSVGGAIGLALYAALALGVSLYLIGFAEAFVAATGWSPTGNMKDDLRVIGTGALVAMSVLTLYSTSIALKSQLFVLAAIVLSLVSVFFGIAVTPLPGEAQVAMTAPKGAPDFATVFAVFFPAVTGFTAGVGMSGDLKDPKRAIPIGTIGAIVFGLVIYIVMTLFVARQASVQQLQLDYNILLRIAAESKLVTAGVFAATLSSALGSILGAPRTLQALAFDGIVPSFFGRGKGEPRVALVATIVIAEAGILLGELEVVGAVLSMFFLTCYGFLCLACGLERWASPDFRPQFKVPIWVSLVGAIACFMVMFQINALAMFGAITLMALIYLFLKRRQLSLASGDLWGGVWSAVVRMGLLRLSQSTSAAHARNWRPNMVVSSRPRHRRAMIEFAKDVVGDRGILTHFDFIQGSERKTRVDEALEAEYPGIFARVAGCRDPFASIPELVANFGLAGMETNVVLIGWPQDASNNKRYTRMVSRLIELDVSLLMMRYSADKGFGKRERVDVWWDGEAPTGQLMLTLTHLLASSSPWKNARVRLLVNGRRGHDEASAKKRLNIMINEARIDAEGVLLPPLADDRSAAERIRQESSFADLVVIHAAAPGEDEEFVEVNDRIVGGLGTALLVRPSTAFKDAPAIFDVMAAAPETPRPRAIAIPQEMPLALVAPVERLLARVQEAQERFHEAVAAPSLKEELSYLEAVEREVEDIRQLPRRLGRRGRRREAARGLVDWAMSRFGNGVLGHTNEFARNPHRKEEDDWQRRLELGRMRLQGDLQEAITEVPASVAIATDKSAYAAQAGDALGSRLMKAWVRLRIGLGAEPPPRRVRLRAYAEAELAKKLPGRLEPTMTALARRRLDALGRARRLVSDVERTFQNLRAELDQSPDENLDSAAFKDLTTRELLGLERNAAGIRPRFLKGNEVAEAGVQDVLRRAMASVVASLMDPSAEPAESDARKMRRAEQALEQLPARWSVVHEAMAEASGLDVRIASLGIDARRAVFQLVHRVRRELEQGALRALHEARSTMLRVEELWQVVQEAEERSDPPQPAAEEDGEETPWTEEEAEAQAEPEAPVEVVDLREACLTAADELRRTWDNPQRPNPREFIDALLVGLGRATEHVPDTVTTLDEASLDRAAEHAPDRPTQSYPARRLAQTFLEEQIVTEARRLLAELPDKVASAQETLVDAVRLVAFELEHAAGAEEADARLDDENVGTLALGGILQERKDRLEQAQAELDEYADRLQHELLEEAVLMLRDVRGAVVGGATGLVTPPKARARAQAEVAREVKAALRAVEGRVGGALSRVRPTRHRVTSNGQESLADQILALREQLGPKAEVQARLPIIYRRVFGRAPLENSDMMCGRQQAFGVLQRAVQRWGGSAGGPVGVVGPPRSGRTSLANLVSRELLSERTVVRIHAPAGGTADPEQLNEAVVKAVGARPGQGAEGALRGMPPGAVVVVDELGRWVERAPGGLSALNLWLRLFRRLGDRHLFVVTSTPWVWSYAEALTGMSQSFLGVARTEALSRDALLDAVTIRQRTTEFQLMLSGQRRRLWQSAEREHVRRLFERSRGNVGEALDLWRSSIAEVGERTIRIEIKDEPNIAPLQQLPAHWYAVLGALAFHRSMSPARVARVLRRSREEATGLLTDLERAGLVEAERAGVWSLDPILQSSILRALKRQGVLT